MQPTVVISRKDKRLHKGWHLFAFMLTGGMSAPVTAIKAGTNAAYNRRTQELTRSGHQQVGWTDEEKAYFAAHVPESARR